MPMLAQPTAPRSMSDRGADSPALRLTPSLTQSGESANQGSITKTGSGYARRLLVEAAWHYARQPAIGATLRNRRQGLPDHILEISWRAQHRLKRLDQRLRARGKPADVVNVAIAREPSGFILGGGERAVS